MLYKLTNLITPLYVEQVIVVCMFLLLFCLLVGSVTVNIDHVRVCVCDRIYFDMSTRI